MEFTRREKQCATCQLRKPLKLFPKDRKVADGRGAVCNLCMERKKVCAHCRLTKVASQFARDPGQPDKRARVCKPCALMLEHRKREKQALRLENVRNQAAYRALIAMEERGEPISTDLPATPKKPTKPQVTIEQDLCLTSTEVRELRERISREQGDRCAICQRPFSATVRRHLDHQHGDSDTGRKPMIRGVLCASCNTMLGMAREDHAVLLSAVEYLKEHGSKA